MLTLVLSLLLAPALADDWDIDIDGIDLSGDGAKGEELVSYRGSTAQTAPDLAPGTLVTISHRGGTVTVNCVDRAGISARVDYILEGTSRDALKRFGDGVGLRAWGSSRGGGVQTKVGSAPGSIKSKQVPLVVSIPKNASVKINGGSGYVQVTGCEGSVAAANSSGDILITGHLSGVTATAPKGDVTIDIAESATLTGSSRVSAGGNAKLKIPSDYGGRISARGQQVQVRHLVDGTETDTQVQGTIGTGSASLSISAKGSVEVQTSQ